MTTGHLIRKLRLQKGMTQEELAASAYTNVRTIQRIENDEVNPRAYTLQSIASVLEVDFEELMDCDQSNSEDVRLTKSNVWLSILHLSGLFILLFPPLIIWIWKKDQVEDMREHGIDVINFQLSVLILLLPAGILAGLIITLPIVIFLGIGSTVIIVVNTIKVINNQPYKYPLIVKILKP